MRHKRMRKARHVAAGNFTIGVEGRIEQGDINGGNAVFNARAGSIPILPAINIGNEQRGFIWAANFKPGDFRKFLAVRHKERCDAHPIGELFGLVFFHDRQKNIVIDDELTPRTMFGEKIRHARHREHLNILCARCFMSEKHQSCIVTNMRVG